MNENIKAGADLHAGDGGYSIGTQKKYEEFVKARNYSMSETRIGQLAKQVYGTQATEQEVKFAELIIQECADIATIHQQNHAHDSIGRYVLDHFGVEE